MTRAAWAFFAVAVLLAPIAWKVGWYRGIREGEAAARVVIQRTINVCGDMLAKERAARKQP